MVNIRMLWDMQGSRYDDRPWPGYMGIIDVPEWEAEHMVSGGTAEYPDAPLLDRGYDVLKVADPNYESKLKFADGGIVGPSAISDFDIDDAGPVLTVGDDDFDSDFDSYDDDNEVKDVTTSVKRPTAADKKEVWIEWAVSKGADQEEAKNKTKAALIADY